MALSGIKLNLSSSPVKGASAQTKPVTKQVLAATSQQIPATGGAYPIAGGAYPGGAYPIAGGVQKTPAPGAGAPPPQPSGVWDDNARNAGGGQDNSAIYSQIDSSYNPMFDLFNTYEGQGAQLQKSQLGDVESQYAKDYAAIQPEQNSLEKDIYSNEQRFGGDVHSAYDEAYRAYNALQQQGAARFGRGSSAYGAASDLSQQELLRQTGKIGAESTQGALEFEKQRGQLKQYITSKVDTLDKWKKDAVAKINDNFTNLINNINSNRAATEQQKARDKMSLLQNTIAQSQSVAQAETQFKQQLALFAVQQISNTTGQQFTPQEIKFQIQDIMSNLNPSNPQTPSQTGASGVGGLGGLLGKPQQDQNQLPGY